MTRVLMNLLNAPALLLLFTIAIALQTSLFAFYPLNYLQPDIVLVGVIWFALHRNFTEGGILTLLLAEIAEIHTSAPQGLFLLTYILIYLIVRALCKFVAITDLSALVLLSMGASIAWKLLCLFILYLLGISENQWKHTFVLMLPGSVMVGVTSIWIYKCLKWFDWVTYKDTRARKILEDELQLEGEGL